MVLKKNIKERKVIFVYRTFTFFGCPFQGHSTNETLPKCSPSGTKHIKILCARLPTIFPYNPEHITSYLLGLGSSLFTRRYSGNKNSFFFSSAYWDVSLQRVRPKHIIYVLGDSPSANQVSPLGNPRIKGC